MGDGHRTSVLDLLPENRNDAAVGAEHVAETRGHELGHTLHLALLYGLIEALAVDLAYPLAASHHVGRIDGLVGGYHHELLRAVLDGKVRDDSRSVDIVLHSDCRVILHHRHVLVGCRVEDVFRLMLTEDALHMLAVGNAGHYSLVLDVRILPLHHQAYVVHRGLRLIDEYHLRRMVLGNLAHHFGAYRAGSAGDEYPFPGEKGADGIHIHLYLLPRQQVLDGHLMQAVVAEGALASVPLLGLRHHHDLDAGGEELIHHLLVVPEDVVLQRGDQKHLHSFLLEALGQPGDVQIDRLAHQVGSFHLHPVGYEGIEVIRLLLVDVDALGKADAAGLGAVDGYRNGIVAAERVIKPLDDDPLDPQQQRADGEEHHRHREIREKEDPLPRPYPVYRKTEQPEGNGRDERRRGHTLQVNE